MASAHRSKNDKSDTVIIRDIIDKSEKYMSEMKEREDDARYENGKETGLVR